MDADVSKTHKLSTSVDDRREELREPATIEDARIWTSPKTVFAAKVIDESIGGIAALVEVHEDFQISMQILVEHSGSRRLAEIVGVSIHESGQVRLSLRWDG